MREHPLLTETVLWAKRWRSVYVSSQLFVNSEWFSQTKTILIKALWQDKHYGNMVQKG